MTQPDNLLAEARALVIDAIERINPSEARPIREGITTPHMVAWNMAITLIAQALKRAEDAEQRAEGRLVRLEAAIAERNEATQRNERLAAALEAVDQAERSNCRGPDADKHQRAQWRGAMRKVRTALNEVAPHG